METINSTAASEIDEFLTWDALVDAHRRDNMEW